MDVERAPDRRAACVEATGELDIATAPVLEEELDALLGDGYRELVLDVGEVRFCDLAGLNVLLHARTAAVAAGGGLALHGTCPSLRMMLEVLGLERVFEVIPRNGEAAPDQA